MSGREQDRIVETMRELDRIDEIVVSLMKRPSISRRSIPTHDPALTAVIALADLRAELVKKGVIDD